MDLLPPEFLQSHSLCNHVYTNRFCNDVSVIVGGNFLCASAFMNGPI